MRTPVLPDPAIEPVLTPRRVADILDMSVRGVQYAAARGDIPAVRTGKLWHIPTAEFLAKYRLTAA